MSFLPLGNGHTLIGSSYGLFMDHYNQPLSVDGLTTYGLTLSPDKKRFVTGLENGLIRIFKTEDGSKEASLFINEEEDWVLWTPDGYYTASLKGAQSVAWQTNLGPKTPQAIIHSSNLI
jgi:WD40 repeat protein